MSVARRARNFLRRPAAERFGFIVAWILLGLARLALRGLSFRWLATRLGRDLGPHAVIPLLTAEQAGRARRVGSLVRWTATRTPWRSDCFPQAIAARLLLAAFGVPSALNLGVRRGAGELHAHAWLVAGPVPVTGGRGFDLFTVVACYV